MSLLKLSIFIVTLMNMQFIVFGGEYVFADYLTERWSQGWKKAENICQDRFNTHLASIHSAADNAKVASMCADYDGYACWIGLRYSEEDDEFQWSDGTDLDYVNWYPNLPSTITNNETGSKLNQCVKIKKESSNTYAATWVDDKCSDYPPIKVICNTPEVDFSELGQTLCVSGLAEGYKILNGQWEAVGRSFGLDYEDYSEPLTIYDDCIDYYIEPGWNACLYTLETCLGHTYFMWTTYFDGVGGPRIFHQHPGNSDTWNENDAYDPWKFEDHHLIINCEGNGVYSKIQKVQGYWGHNGYENITFTYGECE